MKRTDTVDKKAAYAAAGIPVHLIGFLSEAQDCVERIEEYRLSEGLPVCLHTRAPPLASPIPWMPARLPREDGSARPAGRAGRIRG
ncbi:hypothetical protein GCM10010439_21360 [Actinocorallia aurantiaca]|uniref:Uncharacterized protein n=1 Tax=Actinocorallia aurantiaca TaxID=46204 RepID=A0ABN3U538_9ACTN